MISELAKVYGKHVDNPVCHTWHFALDYYPTPETQVVLINACKLSEAIDKFKAQYPNQSYRIIQID